MKLTLGGNGGNNCRIVPTGTTDCTGVAGTNCTDQANLKVNQWCSISSLVISDVATLPQKDHTLYNEMQCREIVKFNY